MKFLLFNAVVAVALAYLLMGGDRNRQTADISAALEQGVKSVVDAAKSVATPGISQPLEPVLPVEEPPAPTAKPEMIAEKPAPTPTPQAKPARRAPAPAGQDVAVTWAPDVPALPPVTQPAAKVEAALDPAVAQRRAEVLGEAPDAAAKPTFMSAADRKRELMRLAEDMELRFLGSVRQ